MFERIAIQNQVTGSPHGPLDLGLIIETLIFYGQVNLVIDHSGLQQLLRYLTPQQLVELAESEAVNILNFANFPGILMNQKFGIVERHQPGVYTVHGSELRHQVIPLFRKILNSGKAAERLGCRFLDAFVEMQYPDDLRFGVENDLLDSTFVDRAVPVLLDERCPGYRQQARDLRFEVTRDGDKLSVASNIDWTLASMFRQAAFGESETFTVSNVLAQLSGPQTELYVASTLGSELIMSPENVPLARLRIERLVSSQEASAAPRESFQSMTLGNGTAIREAVNSGERSLSEGLELVEKAHKFKHWIAGRPPDADLLRDYYQEITASTWAEGLPAKLAEWVIFTGGGVGVGLAIAGPLGAVAGGAIGTTQTILDALKSGWKPSQFVDRELKRFVGK